MYVEDVEMLSFIPIILIDLYHILHYRYMYT